MNRIARFFWDDLPAAVSRAFRSLAAILADGHHLRSFPPVAALAPVAVFSFGFLVAWLQPGFSGQETAAGTLWILCVLIAIGTQSTGLGLWTLIGYALADQLLVQHHPIAGVPPDLPKRIGLAIGYVVLAGPPVFNPLVARAAAVVLRLPHSFPRFITLTCGTVIFAIANALFDVAWMRSAAVLLRPVYTFGGVNPSREVIEPLQHTWGWVAGAAVVAAVARVVIETIALRKPGTAARSMALRARLARPSWFGRLPAVVRAAVGALIFTALLAGTYGGWVDAVLVFALASVGLALRTRIAGALRGWARWVAKVPLLLRVAIVIPLLFACGYLVLDLFWGTTHTLRPVLGGAALAVLVATLVLFPRRRSNQRASSKTAGEQRT